MPLKPPSEYHQGMKLGIARISLLVAALGVKDLIVIETEDVLFLCHADRAQSVGELAKTLRRKGLGKFLK